MVIINFSDILNIYFPISAGIGRSGTFVMVDSILKEVSTKRS